MLKLAWPWILLSAFLPLLIAIALPSAKRLPGAAIRLPFLADIDGNPRHVEHSGFNVALFIATLAWLALVLAAARPQWVDEPIDMPVHGRDLVLAIDISGSMKRKDLNLDGKPHSRLAVVKRVAGEFIERREGDRIGLILFSSKAYLQAPLTFDRKTVKTLLEESAIGLSGELTALGDAVGLAIKRLRERPQDNRVLVLLTDGTNTAGAVGPQDAVRLAADQGLKIYTIGVGDDRHNIAQDFDEETLREIANIGGGLYFRARATDDLEKIYAKLDELEPVSDGVEKFYPTFDLFHWPLGASVLLCAGLLAASLARVYIRDSSSNYGAIEMENA